MENCISDPTRFGVNVRLMAMKLLLPNGMVFVLSLRAGTTTKQSPISCSRGSFQSESKFIEYLAMMRWKESAAFMVSKLKKWRYEHGKQNLYRR